jgi:acyl-CoA dehydrogenase
MGELGLLGIRYDREYGGSELDTLATVVLAEELGRSTYGGFAVTVLVHTDMASPHLHHAGTEAEARPLMPDLIAGRSHRRGGDDRGRCRLRPRRHAHHGTPRRRRVGAERLEDVHHQRGARRRLSSSPPRPASPGATGRCRCSSSRRARRVSRSRGRSTSRAGCRSDTAELVFEDCRIPATNLLGEEHRGFYVAR